MRKRPQPVVPQNTQQIPAHIAPLCQEFYKFYEFLGLTRTVVGPEMTEVQALIKDVQTFFFDALHIKQNDVLTQEAIMNSPRFLGMKPKKINQMLKDYPIMSKLTFFNEVVSLLKGSQSSFWELPHTATDEFYRFYEFLGLTRTPEGPNMNDFQALVKDLITLLGALSLDEYSVLSLDAIRNSPRFLGMKKEKFSQLVKDYPVMPRLESFKKGIFEQSLSMTLLTPSSVLTPIRTLIKDQNIAKKVAEINEAKKQSALSHLPTSSIPQPQLNAQTTAPKMALQSAGSSSIQNSGNANPVRSDPFELRVKHLKLNFYKLYAALGLPLPMISDSPGIKDNQELRQIIADLDRFMETLDIDSLDKTAIHNALRFRRNGEQMIQDHQAIIVDLLEFLYTLSSFAFKQLLEIKPNTPYSAYNVFNSQHQKGIHDVTDEVLQTAFTTKPEIEKIYALLSPNELNATHSRSRTQEMLVRKLFSMIDSHRNDLKNPQSRAIILRKEANLNKRLTPEGVQEQPVPLKKPSNPS